MVWKRRGKIVCGLALAQVMIVACYHMTLKGNTAPAGPVERPPVATTGTLAGTRSAESPSSIPASFVAAKPGLLALAEPPLNEAPQTPALPPTEKPAGVTPAPPDSPPVASPAPPEPKTPPLPPPAATIPAAAAPVAPATPVVPPPGPASPLGTSAPFSGLPQAIEQAKPPAEDKSPSPIGSPPGLTVEGRNVPAVLPTTAEPPPAQVRCPWILRVEIVDGKTQLTAETTKGVQFRLSCERLHLQAPQGSIEAKGAVKLSSAGIEGACDCLTITWQDDRIILEGKAQMMSRRNGMDYEIKGDRVSLRLSAANIAHSSPAEESEPPLADPLPSSRMNRTKRPLQEN